MTTLTPLALLAGRILIVGIFIYDATVILSGWDASVRYVERFGVPAAALPLAVTLQLVGGVMVALGVLTRLTALAFVGFCVMTAMVFHNNLANAGEVLHFGKDLALAGGFLFLVANGAGAWSVDARMGWEWGPWWARHARIGSGG